MKFDWIVVGLDFSRVGLAAISHASALAGPGRIELVHVLDRDRLPRVPMFEPETAERMIAELESEAWQTLNELRREVRSEGVRVSAQVLSGRPADELVRAAQHADLLVVGTASKGLLDGIALGSVAEEIVRTSATPVLVIRDAAEGSAKIARVLAAVDLDDPCLEAIEAAAALASHTGAKLEVAHVVSTTLPATMRGAGGLPEDVASRVTEEAERELRALVSTTLGLAATIRVAFGSPADEIAKLAHGDDVIVTGTHGRGTLGRLAFGSVATRLMRSAPCPVLVVRPPSAAAAS